MTTYYLDTSVAFDICMGKTYEDAAWFDGVVDSETDRLVSSRILVSELTRALRREKRHIHTREVVTENVDLVPLTEAILLSAEAIGPHVKTLDAIHLASALATGVPDLMVVTRDSTMTTVAGELGFHTLDPHRADSGL